MLLIKGFKCQPRYNEIKNRINPARWNGKYESHLKTKTINPRIFGPYLNLEYTIYDVLQGLYPESDKKFTPKRAAFVILRKSK